MPFLCVECAVDSRLIEEAGKTSRPHKCILCGHKRGTAINLSSRSVKELLRALIRFHYDEWDYNGHLGGENFDEMLSKPNPIVVPRSEEAIEQFCWFPFEEGYESDSLGVSLYAGYEDGFQLPPLMALRHDEPYSLRRLRDRLQKENHFSSEKELRKRFRSLRRDVEATVDGQTLVRARLGYEARSLEVDVSGRPGYRPFSGKDIHAPPPPLASAGRLNRPGVSFLYLASDAQTAVAEVRPHPDHLVSVGDFTQVRACRIADFRKVNLRQYCHSDEDLSTFAFLHTIERDFATPVIPEERSRYLLGQLIADVLRQLGFEGIAYRSSIAQGTNFCFFDPASFEYVAKSARLMRITSLHYEMEAARVIADDDTIKP